MRGLAALPESEETKTRWPEPRSSIGGVERPGHQDRSLEVDAQGSRHLPGREVGQQARPRQSGVGDEDVDVARVGGELLGGAGLGQVGR